MVDGANPGAVDRTVLPPPEPAFGGRIEVALEDSTADFPMPLRAPEGAPNVLLIMGDDIGYGHMSGFGGPADTPVFDRLADRGLRFTNFHTSPVCAASRAALLTGRNGHSVGMGAIPETSVGFPGYTASIPRSAATVLEILRQNGYGTAWVGKTHLTPIHEITAAGPFDRWPGGMGAEYFYGFFGPGVSQWHPPLWENSTPVQAPATPEEGYSLEADMADKTIAFIQRQRSIHPEKPWLAFYAPSGHKPPVGVPPEWIERYRGRFDDGYDVLRERTLARQKELGIVSAGTRLATPPPALPAWADLSEADQKVGAHWMEVFCGAVEFTDHQIGRIIDAIEETGDADNTLIIYLAGDNGPTPEGGLHGTMNKLSYFNGVQESLDDLVEQIDAFGTPESHGSYPAAWAYATSTPFTYGKEVTSGGGCSTAAVISWPARISDGGGIRRQFHHLNDIAPTILECVGVPEPVRVNGIDQRPMEGVSMLYTFDDPDAADRHTTQYFELLGGRAIYHDGWWAGTRHGVDGVSFAKTTVPYDQDVWELYDMRADFGQATDLAARRPDKLEELRALFDREARRYNVYPLADNAMALLTADRPKLVHGDQASYGPGTIRLAEDAVINIKNRSFSLTAEIDNPHGDAEGTLVTLGGETGGYALLVVDGRPTFHYNYLGLHRYTITATEPLPTGPCTIIFDFAYDGGGPGKGGTGTLTVNGKPVGEGRIERTVPVYFSTDDTFDVGEDWGTPISPTYRTPFAFTGTLKKVTVQAK
ncbi:arylsulfatase [Jiangella alkaliphila]|uniref:Arylsulfatase n=1 Tax=Jiangella alkaliphila TaxID=419479 RepID=A0A1H2L6A3_9ACTN|nr:arylsulfatase [Jiangella alkaliphila]SDU76513.1 arylsulfatase [Jiangella alkaliphila]